MEGTMKKEGTVHVFRVTDFETEIEIRFEGVLPDLIKAGRPDLGINSATNLDTPNNLIHVILDGVNGPEGMAGVVMPGFRGALNDEQITAIAAYLRDKRANQPVWPNLSETVADIRQNGPTSH